MGEYEFYALMLMLPGLAIVGGIVLLALTVMRGQRQAEFRHRERMAMIERGMAPPDPVLGDAVLQRAHSFKLQFGILMCGLGMALLLLITFTAGAPGIGFGVGGAFAMLGVAFIVSAYATRRDGPSPPPPSLPPLP